MGNFIGKIEGRNSDVEVPKTLSFPIVKVRALYTYMIIYSGDLHFVEGDILFVYSDLTKKWLYAKHSVTSQMGYIPYNYVLIDDGSPSFLESWFDIDRTEAEKKLLLPGYPEGTYIVRPSSDTPHFAISIRFFNTAKNVFEVKHYKIQVLDKGGFGLSHRHSFLNIQSLMCHYDDRFCCRLTKPFSNQHKLPILFREIEINRRCITMEKKLGNSCFGEVWFTKWKNSVSKVVKMLRNIALDQNRRNFFWMFRNIEFTNKTNN